MTDARLPERYLMDRRIARLSDEEWAGYTFALMWSVSNRTDGTLAEDEIQLVPRFHKGLAIALTKAGLLNRIEGGWIIDDYLQTQTSKHDLEVLENARRRDREKKSRQRASKSESPPVPGDIPGDMSRGTAQDRKGKDRLGQAGKDYEASQPDGWPPVAAPGAAPQCPGGEPLAQIYVDQGRRACPAHSHLLQQEVA